MAEDRDYLLLRLDGPLMSFGGVAVDQHGVTEEWPGQSLVTGLLANALGFDHRESGRLERLQSRIRHAARRDRRGEALVDYQTVDLGQPFMLRGWTTEGRLQDRGGASGMGTHIRLRHYWADAVFTVALRLEPEDEAPNLDDCEAALDAPERPLFLGRKACLPAAPLRLGRVSAPSLLEALQAAPLAARATPDEEGFTAWWPADEGEVGPFGIEAVPVHDLRDWQNQVHTGRRFVHRGPIRVTTAPEDAHAD